MFERLLHMSEQEYERYNPPPVSCKWIDDWPYLELLDTEKWLHMGYVPKPSTRLGWFVYHVIHGCLMRYPFHKVLWYALHHTNPEWATVNVAIGSTLLSEERLEVSYESIRESGESNEQG